MLCALGRVAPRTSGTFPRPNSFILDSLSFSCESRGTAGYRQVCVTMASFLSCCSFLRVHSAG